MKTILNETEFAQKILKTGEIGKKPSSTLFLLAKYFQQKKGLDKSETEQELHRFMQKNNPHYNAVLWEQTIENIVKKSASCSLREIDFIGITEQEMAAIRLLKNPRHERLVFVLLIHAKLYDMVSETNHSWANLSVPDLFRLARVTVKHRNDKFLILNDIEKNNIWNGGSLISFSTRNDNLNIQVNFTDTENIPVLKIDDFREPGYEYMQFYKQGRFVRCKECNRLVKIKNKHDFSTKYCTTCKKEKELQLGRERIKKYRMSLS